MKRLLILYAIFAFCLSTVSALQISTPTLSGDTGADVTSTFTVTNDGSFVITNISAVSTADAKYLIHFENIPSSLNPMQSATVTVKGKVPSDFAVGKRSIGSITVTSSAVVSTSNLTNSSFGSHNFVPQNQTAQAVLPVVMSAANDCGQNTPDPGMPIIGQWHSGVCDGANSIFVNQPYSGSVDAGWARIHSNNISDYWVSAVGMDCGGSTQSPPNNWTYGGKIHTGPGICDGQIELQSGDSGWLGLYSKPVADGELRFYVAENKCGSSAQTVPSDGVILGKVSTGPNVCDGTAEGFASDGTALDAGSMYVVYVPVDHTPKNFLPIGEFEFLNSGELRGWAFDNETPASTVNVYVDGHFWKDLTADLNRVDLLAVGKIPDARHGFKYQFSNHDLEAFGNGNHTFSIIAINSPVGDNPALNNSPKVLTVSLPNSTTNTSTNTTTNTTNTTNTSNIPVVGNPNATISAATQLYMETSRHLVIDRVKITCDKLRTVSENSSIDASPGQTCYLTVKVKNTGSKDIENIVLEVDPENSDVTGDDADYSDLDSGDSEEKTVELFIDEEADGDIDIDLFVEGENEDGVRETATFQFSLNVVRAKHNLDISSMLVSPKEAKLCSVTRIDVVVYVENNGQRDEDRAAVELSVPSLNFVKKISDTSIDEDYSDSFTFSIPVNSKTPFGSFKATAKSFYDNFALTDTRTADIVILKCDEVKETKTSEPLVTPPPYVPQDDIIIVPTAEEETNSSWVGSAVLTGILVLANLVALTVLGVMAYGYFKKNPEDEFEEQFDDNNSVEANTKEYY